jgi:transcriptional regulator with GAF, ATPase, and Fis domain/tetratricopeptide (TPR) repeat protein
MENINRLQNSESDDFCKYLTIASIFNNDFSIDWLQLLTASKASQIVAAMEKGVSNKILIRKDATGFYCFSDNKVKKEWLKKISDDDRKVFHRRIAEFLLNDISYDDRQNTFTIAHHLLHIENDNVETCRILVHAGNLYASSYSTQEALTCYKKALSDLALIKSAEADYLFVETTIKYSRISTSLLDTLEVLRVLQEAMVKAKKNNMISYQPIMQMHLAKTEWLRGNYANAIKHFKQGWMLCEEIDDHKLKAQAKVFSAFFLYWHGRFSEAIRTYEQSVTDIDQFPEGTFPLLARITVGACYTNTGQITHGLGMLHAAYTYSLEKGDYNQSSTAAWAIASALLDINQIDNSLEFLKHGLTEAKKCQDYYSMILIFMTFAYIYYLRGDIKNSVSYLHKFLDQSKQSRADVLRNNAYLLEICWAIEQGKYPPTDDVSIDNVIERALHYKNVYVKGVAFRYLAYVQMRDNSGYQKISESFNQSLYWLQMSGQETEIAKTRLALARYCLSLGDQKKAKDMVKTVATSNNPRIKALVPDEFRPFLKDLETGEVLLEEILNLGREVVSIIDTRDLFNHIIATVNHITGAERGTLFVWNESFNPPQLQLRASKNITSEQIAHPNFRSSINMINEVAASGKGLILGPDQGEEKDTVFSENIYSRICVPMVLRNKLVGVLYHDNRLLSSAFKETDIKLLAHFAAFAAFAVANSDQNVQNVQFKEKILAEKSYLEDQQIKNLHFENIIGTSPPMKKIYSLIDQVANTNATVLIEGETGVGKELIARAIYRQSTRRDKPFIRVHSKAIPESLIASEFFGHEKGSFTGAVSRRIGRFELADEGTLFLDEIGELSLDIQVRLLRVLQTKEFERVGGSETLSSDFRLIVATNRNLEEEVKAGRFRADLYYRLNVFPITIPPLRERTEDLQELIKHFIHIYSTQSGKSFTGISETDMEKLMNYNWPGNVRELENIIERATILSKGPLVQIPELWGAHSGSQNLNAGLTLRENERNHILWALHKTKWKIHGDDGAAKILDIHPSTLQSRMKKLGIKKPLQN